MRNEWDYNAWKTLSGGAMKKYLFGLGAMLVGAGLMFVLMHGEVSADSKPEPFVCSYSTSFPVRIGESPLPISLIHCKAKNIDCAVDFNTGHMSCVD